MGRPSLPLSANLPPLIMGTATFNWQYNADPYALPSTELVHRALSSGVRAFDTSPYYGPAEELLGRALATDFVQTNFPRYTYRLLTKVGRVAGAAFDYSPEWVRHSVRRSLRRLHTDYLDVVYCHDVEFVTPDEVVAAVRELRRIRDTDGTVHYVGISGYPVEVLCELAERVRRETGEPLDAVMSYANFTLQNTRLRSLALPRLRAAGVDVVPNASPLGMGLLRRVGVPVGSMGDFHPAPDGLRAAIHRVAAWLDAATDHTEKLEVVAIRFALEAWLRDGAPAGALGPPLAPAPDADPGFLSVAAIGTGHRLGVSVMGVSSLDELNETLRVWRSIIDGLEHKDDDDDSDSCDTGKPVLDAIPTPDDGLVTDRAWSRARRARIADLARHIQTLLGPDWLDYTWPSPDPGFVNTWPAEHVALREKLKTAPGKVEEKEESMLTPPLDAVDTKIPVAAPADVAL